MKFNVYGVSRPLNILCRQRWCSPQCIKVLLHNDFNIKVVVKRLINAFNCFIKQMHLGKNSKNISQFNLDIQ